MVPSCPMPAGAGLPKECPCQSLSSVAFCGCIFEIIINPECGLGRLCSLPKLHLSSLPCPGGSDSLALCDIFGFILCLSELEPKSLIALATDESRVSPYSDADTDSVRAHDRERQAPRRWGANWLCSWQSHRLVEGRSRGSQRAL